MFTKYNQPMVAFNGKEFLITIRDETNDFNIMEASLAQDEYGLADFKLKDDDIFIDVGSSIGSEVLSVKAINPKTKVYSYDPLPENIELLRQNVMQNELSGVHSYIKAVASKKGKIKVYYGKLDVENGKHHHFIGNLRDIPRGKHVEVETITLKGILAQLENRQIKILKLDAEGIEYDILKSASIDTLKKFDWIIGEHHGISRKKVFEATRGLFKDMPCKYQSEGNLAHFRFKNKNSKD